MLVGRAHTRRALCLNWNVIAWRLHGTNGTLKPNQWPAKQFGRHFLCLQVFDTMLDVSRLMAIGYGAYPEIPMLKDRQ